MGEGSWGKCFCQEGPSSRAFRTCRDIRNILKETDDMTDDKVSLRSGEADPVQSTRGFENESLPSLQ